MAADPTCLIIHPFSYASPSSFGDEFPKENSTMMMYGIQESVSFGRFMSDNLEWEKWSSFSSNRNRYVEEAEMYSKPGSVAQKKAYFEAHFKRMAALKAAALLEQANAVENCPAQKPVGEQGVCFTGTVQDVQNLNLNVEIEANNRDVVEKVQEDVEIKDCKGFAVHQNDLISASTENEVNSKLCDDVNPTESVKLSNQKKPCSISVQEEAVCQSTENQPYGVIQRDKPPLQKKMSFVEEVSEITVKKNPPLSSYMSPSVGGTGRAPHFAESGTKYAGSVSPGKENYATPSKKKINFTDPEKKKTPLRQTINREINRIISPVIRRIGTSSRASKDCSTPLKTPSKSMNASLESPRMTPSRGARSRLDSFADVSKASGSRWHNFSSDASMSPSTGRHRISSPIIPNSFCLNGERATRRKQKLEDKFNATATERPPHSSKFKEKAEAELNKFRQSFCFKAMASPDHYSESEALTSPKQKDEPSQGKSPKRGKQPTKTTSQSKVSLPPRRPLIKQSGSKNVQKISSTSNLRSKKIPGLKFSL